MNPNVPEFVIGGGGAEASGGHGQLPQSQVDYGYSMGDYQYVQNPYAQQQHAPGQLQPSYEQSYGYGVGAAGVTPMLELGVTNEVEGWAVTTQQCSLTPASAGCVSLAFDPQEELLWAACADVSSMSRLAQCLLRLMSQWSERLAGPHHGLFGGSH